VNSPSHRTRKRVLSHSAAVGWGREETRDSKSTRRMDHSKEEEKRGKEIQRREREGVGAFLDAETSPSAPFFASANRRILFSFSWIERSKKSDTS
jgi:hypothetical protein